MVPGSPHVKGQFSQGIVSFDIGRGMKAVELLSPELVGHAASG
jgi:hypothetical protein